MKREGEGAKRNFSHFPKLFASMASRGGEPRWERDAADEGK